MSDEFKITRYIENEPPKANKNFVEVVRCGECKYASDNKVYGCMLNHFNDNDYDYHRMYADDFCSRGERKEQ